MHSKTCSKLGVPERLPLDRVLELECQAISCCDIYAHYACVANCTDAKADAWEDTAGYAQADCLLGNVLKCWSTGKWGLL